MPELPEVEVLRRELERALRGRRITRVALSGLRLRVEIPRTLPRRMRGRMVRGVRRLGKYLFIDLDGDLTLLSHLGMTGWWTFHRRPPLPRRAAPPAHAHARITFSDGSELWFEDARRFGLLRPVPTARLERDPALSILGPDPLASPLSGAALGARARGRRVSIKVFLLDQRRIAGIGNIYASEILYRAGVDPRRRAGSLTRAEWKRIGAAIGSVLLEAIDNLSPRSRSRRRPEVGDAGDAFRVYARADEPCPRCGARIRRIVQGQRATFFCPVCQRRRR